MSYVRFGSDGSEVYVFESSAGIECCGCWLQEREWVDDPDRPIFKGYFRNVGETVPYVFGTPAEMIAHLDAHRAAGHVVPEYVFEALREEQAQGVTYGTPT